MKLRLHAVRLSFRKVMVTSPSRAVAEPLYVREKDVAEGTKTMKVVEPQALDPFALVAK